jgi:tRNA(fMet)-specific endonuclease VapC
MKYMLDTNTCIYIIKKKPMNVIKRFQKAGIPNIGISSITLSALFYGVEKSSQPDRNRMAVTLFAAPLKIFPYGHQASPFYGKIRCHLERKGTPVGAMDLLIAAQALSERCVLVTNNEREFKSVPALKIENWVE